MVKSRTQQYLNANTSYFVEVAERSILAVGNGACFTDDLVMSAILRTQNFSVKPGVGKTLRISVSLLPVLCCRRQVAQSGDGLLLLYKQQDHQWVGHRRRARRRSR
jgi:hypothetical protein